MWHLDCATNLNPKFLEAIEMKEEITGKEVTTSRQQLDPSVRGRADASTGRRLESAADAIPSHMACRSSRDDREPACRPQRRRPDGRQPVRRPHAEAPTTDRRLQPDRESKPRCVDDRRGRRRDR